MLVDGVAMVDLSNWNKNEVIRARLEMVEALLACMEECYERTFGERYP